MQCHRVWAHTPRGCSAARGGAAYFYQRARNQKQSRHCYAFACHARRAPGMASLCHVTCYIGFTVLRYMRKGRRYADTTCGALHFLGVMTLGRRITPCNKPADPPAPLLRSSRPHSFVIPPAHLLHCLRPLSQPTDDLAHGVHYSTICQV